MNYLKKNNIHIPNIFGMNSPKSVKALAAQIACSQVNPALAVAATKIVEKALSDRAVRSADVFVVSQDMLTIRHELDIFFTRAARDLPGFVRQVKVEIRDAADAIDAPGEFYRAVIKISLRDAEDSSEVFEELPLSVENLREAVEWLNDSVTRINTAALRFTPKSAFHTFDVFEPGECVEC